MGMTSGVWYTASLFFLAFVAEFGGNYASTAGIFSLFTVLYGAWGIPVGYLADRFGPRRVVLAGGVLLPASLLLSASAGAAWQLYISHSILSSLGLAATSYVPVSLLLTRHFAARRGLGFGIASAGVGLGILVFVPLSELLIDRWSWRAAYRALAAIVSLVILPVAGFALRSPGGRPETAKAGPPEATAGRAAARREGSLISVIATPAFWLVAGVYVFLNAPTQLILTHHVAHLVEAEQPRSLVAQVVGLVGLFSIPAKIGWGWVSERVCLELIYSAGALALGLAALALLSVGPASAVWHLYAYALLLGVGYAASAAMNPVLSGRFFAGRHFGVVLGILHTFYHGGGAAGIWLAGHAHDLTGGYRPALVASLCSAGVAAGLVWLAAPRRVAAPGDPVPR